MIIPLNHENYLVSSERPSGFECQSAFLFSSPNYLKLFPPPDFSFYLINQNLKRVTGTAFFYEQDNILVSHPEASFGGFDFNENNHQIKAKFLKVVLDQLHIFPIRIRSFPTAYDTQDSELIHSALVNNDFEILKQEPNHHIEVDQIPFKDKIHSMELRKLRHAQKLNYEFREESVSSLGRIFDFVAQCRKEKNYTLSLERTEMLHLANALPGNYKAFCVYDGKETIAASIAVIINDHILYNFYPASAQSHLRYSPAVFLHSGLYRFCQDHGFGLLDLGTSYLQDKPNSSLISFKKNLGGIASSRITYHKT